MNSLPRQVVPGMDSIDSRMTSKCVLKTNVARIRSRTVLRGWGRPARQLVWRPLMRGGNVSPDFAAEVLQRSLDTVQLPAEMVEFRTAHGNRVAVLEATDGLPRGGLGPG